MAHLKKTHLIIVYSSGSRISSFMINQSYTLGLFVKIALRSVALRDSFLESNLVFREAFVCFLGLDKTFRTIVNTVALFNAPTEEAAVRTKFMACVYFWI